MFNQSSQELRDACNLEEEHNALNCFKHSIPPAAFLSQSMLILLLNEELRWGWKIHFLETGFISSFQLLEFGADLAKLNKFWLILDKTIRWRQGKTQPNRAHDQILCKPPAIRGLNWNNIGMLDQSFSSYIACQPELTKFGLGLRSVSCVPSHNTGQRDSFLEVFDLIVPLHRSISWP